MRKNQGMQASSFSFKKNKLKKDTGQINDLSPKFHLQKKKLFLTTARKIKTLLGHQQAQSS